MTNNNIFDDESIVETNSDDVTESESEFITLYDELVSDIGRIDIKLEELQRYITIIDSNISHVESAIAVEKDSAKKARYQQVLRSLMELMISYQDTYQKFLAVKQGYRKNQNNLIRDRFRVKLDYRKNLAHGSGDVSLPQLIEIFSKLQNQLNSADKEHILEDLDNINSDEMYSLT